MSLADRRVAILVEDDYQELELHYPRLRLLEAGVKVLVVGTGKPVYTSSKGYEARSDVSAEEVDPGDLDALVIPGGMAPDRMRRHRAMVELVRAMHDQGKPVAWICHGGWMAVSAGILRGRRATSFHSIRDDMSNAGADWHDEEVVQDGNLISSRTPDDLPAFCRALLKSLA